MSTTKNLTIDQGSLFYANLQYTDASKNPISLAGYTLASQIRKSYYSANAASFTATVIDAANGKLQLSFTSTQTGLIKPGRYVYDVEAISGSDSIRIFEGEVTVTPGVTGNTYGTIFVSTEAIRGPQGNAGVASNVLVNGIYVVDLQNDGSLYLPYDNSFIYGNQTVGIEATDFAGNTSGMFAAFDVNVLYSANNVILRAKNTGPYKDWLFDIHGDITLPNNGSSIRTSWGGLDLVAPPNGYVEMADAESNTYIWIQTESAWIGTNWNTASHTWEFKKDGSVDFPYQATNARTGSGSALVFPKNEHQKIIATQNGVDTYPTVDRLVIAGGDGYGTGEGGDIYLWAGRSSYDAAGYGSGGDIKVDAGEAYDSEGGTVKIRGGNSRVGNTGNIATNGGFVEIDAGHSWTLGGAGGDIHLAAGEAYNGGTDGKIYLNTRNGQWNFNPGGSITFPDNLIKPLTNYTISLGNYTDNLDDNKVVVNQHSIDLYAYNSNAYSYSELYLDNSNVDYPFAYLEIRSNTGDNKNWQFDSDGVLKLPPYGTITTPATMGSAVTIKAPASGPVIVKNDSGYNSLTVQDSDVRVSTSTSIPYDVGTILYSSGSWEMNPSTNLDTTGGTGTGLTVNITESGGYADTITIQNAGSGYNNGDEITVISGTSTVIFTILTHVKTWKFGADGVTTLPFYVRYPNTARGVNGDKAGMMVVAGAYLYYCYADYTDGTVPIWQKVAMDNTDWD
jgi:hypothetical protein